VRWNKWLEELRRLPPEAREWQAIDEFVAAVRNIAEEKRGELATGSASLEKALAKLRGEHGEQLSFFGFDDVEEWKLEAASPARARDLASKVNRLCELLAQYADARSAKGNTLKEERKRRDTLGKLEQEIQAIHDRLSAELSKPPRKRERPTEIIHEALTEKPEEIRRKKERAEIAKGKKLIIERPPSPGREPQVTKPVEPGEEWPAEQPSGVESGTEAAPARPPVQEGGADEGPSEGGAPPGVVEAPEPTESEGETRQPAGVPLERDWQDFIWRLIDEDDLPGAYWVTKSLMALGYEPVVPDWLLAAVQCAVWLDGNVGPFAVALQDITINDEPPRDGLLALLGLAASLIPAVIAPSVPVDRWLREPRLCPSLRGIVEVLRSFRQTNYPLRPEDLEGATSEAKRKATLGQVSKKAGEWLKAAPDRGTKSTRGARVWRQFVATDLQRLLEPVASDDRRHMERVREESKKLKSRDYLVERTREIDVELQGRRLRPLVGAPVDQLVRRAAEACELADRWCSLIERERQIQKRGNWVIQRVTKLRNGIRDELGGAVEALLTLRATGEAQNGVAAAAKSVLRSLARLADILQVPQDARGQLPPFDDRWSWLRDRAGSLEEALSLRLLWLPEARLDDQRMPLEDSLKTLAEQIQKQVKEQRTLREAFQGWLDVEDYRFAGEMLTVLGREEDSARLSSVLDERKRASAKKLNELKTKTLAEVEQAVVDGIIGEERSKLNAEIVAIDPASTEDFRRKRAKLQSVSDKVQEARSKRLRELQHRWDNEIQPRLDQYEADREEKDKISARVRELLRQGDTRVVEECVARLTEVMDARGRLDESSIMLFPDVQRRPLEEFQKSRPAIEGWLRNVQGLTRVAKGIREGETHAGLSFGQVPEKRRREAAHAIAAWDRLKRRRGLPEPEEPLTTIVRFLGFEVGYERVREVKRGADWVMLRVKMTASNLARPIPQFGSQAERQYDIVCLWERPGADTIAARLGHIGLSRRTVLAMYLGRLTERQLNDIGRVSREQQLALAVLDETLLIFLAAQRDARLPVFLRCALPYACVNPYTPFSAGEVPPEIFFGREEMLRELINPSGSCLVYGGRQLGKSALLRRAVRELHDPDNEQYAFVKDIKTVGDPQAGHGPEHLWRHLRDGLADAGLLVSARIEKSERIAEAIRKAVLSKPRRRVLALLDEADHFLDADAKENFGVTNALRQLMFDTNRRFKVVLAGLHNVQRFHGIPNQPLAHFGTPILVGPLEPRAARQLVVEPLEALGYRFENEAAVLRILSFTNYHPGLIQLFCHRLIKQKQAEAQLPPPFVISQADVEEVYRNREVYDGIRDRFDWTLALDPRYQAIAWSLIYEQQGREDSYAAAYAPSEIHSLAKFWWPAGFAGVSFDEFRGKLDEMCGLGVLVRDERGHYRLRSPNLVRLMGTQADVEQRLLDFTEKQPPVSFAADSHHAIVDDAKRLYSPFTHAQERALSPMRFGVGLVFVSDALGSRLARMAIRRFAEGLSPEARAEFAEVPQEVVKERRLERWLEAFLKKKRDRQRLVVSVGMNARGDAMAEQVETALEFCRRHQKSERRWCRVFFVFTPAATWRWMRLPQEIRSSLEDRVDAAVCPRPWDDLGIRQRLNQSDKMDSGECCDRVRDATGGWPILLDELFERLASDNDPRPVAKQMKSELVSLDSPLAQQFLRSLGVEMESPPGLLLRELNALTKDQDSEAFTEEFLCELLDEIAPGMSGESAAAVDFLRRMACLHETPQGLVIDPIVRTVMPRE